jgi:4,5:9,10-diseco-3-hydroxy-5,9,17-trioxoandrosta-1(10),2-diene-4-oate hydrolase
MRHLTGSSGNKFVEVHGVRLSYDDEGDGIPIVCLHAIAHGAADYDSLRERLREQYRIIALDWPGHGKSGDDPADPSDARYAELLAEFVRQLELDSMILIGNSIGGAAAIRFTATHPDLVRVLVVANPGGLFQRAPGVKLFLRLFARFFEAGANGAKWYPPLFTLYYNRVLLRAPAAAQRARIIAAARDYAPLLARAWRGFAENSSDLRELAAQIRCPVLVAWATRDIVNPLWANRSGIRRFADVQLAKFRAGHVPFLETPDEFVSTLLQFLEQIQARTEQERLVVGTAPTLGGLMPRPATN